MKAHRRQVLSETPIVILSAAKDLLGSIGSYADSSLRRFFATLRMTPARRRGFSDNACSSSLLPHPFSSYRAYGPIGVLGRIIGVEAAKGRLPFGALIAAAAV
jgi:hypothetical protein